MYNDKNYAGAIDQLTQLQMMPIDAKMAECAEFYIALCRYERNESQSSIALQQYILSHPSSPNVDLAWATIGNHLFSAGKYCEAVRHYDKVRLEALDTQPLAAGTTLATALPEIVLEKAEDPQEKAGNELLDSE